MIVILRYFLISVIWLPMSIAACDDIAIPSQTIEIYTEVWPPYQFIDENNNLDGIAVNQVQGVLNKLGWRYNTHILPWARTYQSTRRKANSLIYSITRTPEREKQFHWIYQLDNVKTYLLRLADRVDIEVNDEQDILRYRLALRRDAASLSYFKSLGVDMTNNVILVNNSEQALKLVAHGRVDFYPITNTGFLPIIANSNFRPELFTFAFELKDLGSQIYLAANIDSDKQLITTLTRIFSCYGGDFYTKAPTYQ